MSLKKPNYASGIRVVPDDVAMEGLEGEIKASTTNPRLKTYIEGQTRDVVTVDQIQTLTNKSISADSNTISELEVDNLKAGVLNTSTSLSGASDDQIPSALAVKTYVDNSSGSVQADVDDLITLSGVPANSTDLGSFSGTTIPDGQTVKEALQDLETAGETTATNLANHISDPTGAHAASAISNTPSGNMSATDVQGAVNELQGDIDTINNTSLPDKVTGPASATDNAVALYDGATGKLIKNSTVIVNVGAVTGVTDLTASGTVQQATSITTGVIRGSEQTDSTTTGANATISSVTAPEVRLTNASLTSVDMIAAGAAGQIITLSNLTGNSVTFNNDTGGTAGNRIYTGTSASINLANQATLILRYDSSSARWLVIGGTGAGGGSALSTIFQLDCSEQLSTWSTGRNPVVMGGGLIAGSFVKNTSTPMNGLASYQYTQNTGSLNDYIMSPAQPVAVRFRGNTNTLTFPYQYDGSNNDISVVVYDVTNGVVLTQNSLTGIPASNGVTSNNILSVFIPSTCASIRIGFQVGVVNNGKILQFDDVVLSANATPAATLPVVTEWQAYTPTFTGFGTPSNVAIQFRRVGDSVEIRGSFTSGIPTTTEARISLPMGYISKNSNSISPLETVGMHFNNKSGSANKGGSTLIEPGVGYITLGAFQTFSGTGVTALAKANGNAVIENGDVLSFTALVPVSGLSANNPLIVAQPETFSTDQNPLTYAGSATYTLATLSNAPVGTFITYTYGASGNTRTQTNSAPTQTTSDMNTNGILMYPRVYASASTAAQPSTIAIQIGKGMKGVSNRVYKAAGKTTAGSTDYAVISSGTTQGLYCQDYNESTGILFLDIGVNPNTSIVSNGFAFNDLTSGNGYVVINASRNPALTGITVKALKWQVKYLAASASSGTLTDLTFNNLVIGKTYRASYQFYMQNTTNRVQTITTANGSVPVQTTFSQNGFGDRPSSICSGGSSIFVATATTLVTTLSASGGSGNLTGNGTKYYTWMQLEEISGPVQTTEWT